MNIFICMSFFNKNSTVWKSSSWDLPALSPKFFSVTFHWPNYLPRKIRLNTTDSSLIYYCLSFEHNLHKPPLNFHWHHPLPGLHHVMAGLLQWLGYFNGLLLVFLISVFRTNCWKNQPLIAKYLESYKPYFLIHIRIHFLILFLKF